MTCGLAAAVESGWRLRLLLGATALALLFSLGPVTQTGAATSCSIATKSWTGAASASFFDAGNWSPAGAPGVADNVCITNVDPGHPAVTIATGAVANVNSLQSSKPITITSGGLTLVGAGGQGSEINGTTLALSGGTLAGAGDLLFAAGSTFLWNGDSRMTGAAATTVAAGATLTIDPSFNFGNRFLRSGRTLNLSGTGSWVGAENIQQGEGSVFNIGGTLTISNDQVDNWCCGAAQPVVRVLAGGTLRKNGGTGTSTFSKIPVTVDGTASVSAGILDFSGGLTNFDGATSTLNGGGYIVSDGAKLRFPNANIVTNAASITLAGTGSQILDLADQDALRNLAANAAGSQLILLPAMTVPGAFSNSGLLSIGDTGDSFTTTTTFTQTSTGALGITIGGTIPGTNLGHLQVGGVAAYAGTLALTTDPAFTPSESQKFTIANYASKSGKFSSITGVQIPSTPLAYKVVVGSTSIVLTAMQAADLKLSGTAPSSVPGGSAFDYSWTIDNLGPGVAKAVVLTDKLPAGVAFVSASPGCTAIGQKVTCKPPNMNGGTSVSFTIRVTAPTTPGTVKNTASVKTSSLDLDLTNNKKKLTTKVS